MNQQFSWRRPGAKETTRDSTSSESVSAAPSSNGPEQTSGSLSSALSMMEESRTASGPRHIGAASSETESKLSPKTPMTVLAASEIAVAEARLGQIPLQAAPATVPSLFEAKRPERLPSQQAPATAPEVFADLGEQPRSPDETMRLETQERAPAIAPVLPAIDKKSPEPRPSGGRGDGGGAGSGGGGRGNGGRPMEQRSSEREFREVLTKGLATCRRNLVTVAVFSFVVNLLVLAVPIYLFNVSDRVLTSRSTDTLVMLTIVIVGALGVHVLLDMIRRFILVRIAAEAESKLGAPVLSAAAKASQNGSSREYQTLGDLQHLRSFITGPVLITMLDAPVAPIYLLAVFLVHPHLGWIVATTGLALLVVALVNQKLTAVSFGQANAFAVRANLQADAMARNSQVINAMGMIPEAVVIWGRETAESLKAQIIAQDRNILMSTISKFLRLCTQVAILGWGAWLALKGELTGGMLIAASIVGSRALAPLEGTIEGWRNFIQAKAAYARIKTLIQNSPLNFDRLRLPRPEGRLTVERILFVPPPTKKVILNGVNFQLEPGESLAVVGSSGMGKSTLARMLVGSITPTAGSVRLDMMELRNWDPRQLGEAVGYLPQEVQLFPATIKANIARMREDATDEAIFEAADLADVHAMISEFPQGYETTITVDGSPLSGGQKQRIALARAFFGNPCLVVLDEPNSNLDAAGERALAKALARAKEKGVTVVAITQRPSLLKSVDKIMVMKDGAVQILGKRDDVMPILTGRKPGDNQARSLGDGSILSEG
ncbi:type I secretion system permease/ATPase [Bradyrhizobium sp.]|uniref:type I secretion system permease/ATPase n=1 Tax=Bradyrhizobium sp. TaxID=376 RepID=UPI0025BABED1|nr:type I secretion system permease/ATPase [Bradyrhizobium sp.]